MYSAPTIKCNFTDVVSFTQAFDEFFNVAVVNHIAFGGLQETLPFPNIVWHMVAPDTKVEVNACRCTFMSEPDSDYDVYRDVMDVNFFGALRLAKTVLPYMREQKEGRIISLCEYNAAIKIAAELAGAEVADLAAQNLRYETLDGTHPTRAGHATIAQAWINCLGSIMPAGEE